MAIARQSPELMKDVAIGVAENHGEAEEHEHRSAEGPRDPHVEEHGHFRLSPRFGPPQQFAQFLGRSINEPRRPAADRIEIGIDRLQEEVPGVDHLQAGRHSPGLKGLRLGIG